MYALLLEDIREQVSCERQVAAVFMAAGAKDVSMPTYAEAKADLDAALVHVPERIDTDHEELLRALGVR